MRYHLESYLPIEAFKPRGGVGGMTLHGGGGGIISAITDPISNALGTAGGQSGILGALADFDDAVATSVDGGWAGLAEEAAVITASYFGGPLGAAAARTGIEYTKGGERRKNAARTGAEQAAVSYVGGPGGGGPIGAGATKAGLQYTHGGEDRKNALRSGLTTAGTQFAMQGAQDYLSSSDIEAPVTDSSDYGYNYTPDEGSPYLNSVPPDMDLNAPYIDAPDGEVPLTSDPNADPTLVPKKVDLSQLNPDASNVGTSDLGVTAITNPYFDLDADTGAAMRDYANNQQIIAASSAQPPSTTLSSDEELRRMYEANINDLGAGTDPYGAANELPSNNELAKDPFANPRPNFFDDPLKNISNRASDSFNSIKNAPKDIYDYFTDPNRTISDMGSDLYKSVKANPLEYGIGALALSRMGGQKPQPQGQPTGYSSGYGPYTGGYGSSGGVADPYLLRNRVNASNIYNYRNPNTSRYAEGGEVKHFAYGGISNAVTRLTQPIEKAIVQPVGQALPFLRDAAPYAGILAAPFITSPFAAAGVGALSSGFGRPGSGFDMKRALMGGIAAYGASTVGAGLEAAGTENYPMPEGGTGFTSNSVDDAIGAVKESPKSFFRDTDAMQKGVGNLLSSNSDAAMAQFGTKAGAFKSGIPIVMGTSGVMAIDEANKMREESDRASAVGKQEQADMLARISKGRKRAEDAVRENPYMYAMGGSVDDELGGDYSAMGMDQGNMQKGLFGMGYAEGGTPRFLSGGGDGMSDSIPATIGGTQEARLADGEFVIPADVVSHLGNGSSKAGAKQLYSMMDRIRKARTGNEKQGRQIKPKKMMPA